MCSRKRKKPFLHRIYCILKKMILPSLLGLFLVFSADGVDVELYTQRVHRNVNRKFVSVAIDTGVVKDHWANFHPKSTSVKTLAAALSPCYVRVGGTRADYLIFQNDKASGDNKVDLHGVDIDHLQMKKMYLQANSTGSVTRYRRDIGDWLYGPPLVNFTMTATLYDQIHQFVSSVGWDLIFDLNSLLRKPDGAWDSSNPIQLINYTAQSGYKMGGWELGNEPNAYYHHTGRRVEPEQLGEDFVTLHRLLKHYSQFANGELLGPSVTQLNKKRTDRYFESFLSSGGGDVVTAATFHQYYESRAVAEVEDFYNPDILNILHEEVQTGVNLTKEAGSSAKVWLGETGSAWGGGAPNLSDRYVAAFPWLDKLGMSARDGIDALIRQSFYGGHYALLDQDTLAPNPDYWLTLLYKLLVGSRVLRVTSPDSSGRLRVYAHCTETVKSGYPAGSVTVYVMNLDESSTMVEFLQFPSGTQLHVYTMTPPDNDITSQAVKLNGILLQMIDERTLPNLLIPVKVTDSVVVEAKTYTFIVLPNAKLNICL